MNISRQKGFTLIELLVVIAIIGVLSAVVLASLNSARLKGRDAERKSDMLAVQQALEMYYDDFGSYPNSGGAWRNPRPNYGGYPRTGPTGYIPGLAPKYIGVLPDDPSPNGDSYMYLSNGSYYKLLDHGSPEDYQNSTSHFYDPVRPTWAWMLCSGEPACSTW